jgi:phosphoribosylanthranilate isomerase
MPVRVHLNGLTRPEDAEKAAALGVDAFGIFFWPQSSSSVSVTQAREIVSAVPDDALTIAMFVDAVGRTVERTLSQAGIKMALFAGSEDPDYCRRFSGRCSKVIRVRSSASLEQMALYECAFFVLDGDPAVHAGAREVSFDFLLARSAKRWGKVVISGGLNTQNVASVIRTTRPWGVEISAGVESAQGIKDIDRLERFIDICRSA